MKSGNVYESLFKAWTSISDMIVGGGQRDPEEVLRYIQRIIERKDFISVLEAPRNAAVSTEPVGGWAAEYQRFYKEVFNQDVDFSGVEIPAEQPGFGWIVMLAQGLTLNQAWAKCQERFSSEAYMGNDLDKAVPTNDRTTATAYAKRFRNRIEADEENKSFSANDLAKRKLQSNTLLERFILELWYHWKTGGGHLDLVNVTLCAGSRSSGGVVPGVGWYDGQFYVRCDCRPGFADGRLRSRSAV